MNKINKNKFKKTALIINLTGIVMVLICFYLILKLLGNYLVVNEKPNNVDVVVVLAGESTGERVEHGIKLVNTGYASKILFSGYSKEKICENSQKVKDKAIESGILEKNIMLEENAISTYENAFYTKKILEKNNYSSMILVTSSYHSRRANYIFKKVFENTKMKIISSSASVHFFRPNSWWNDEHGRAMLRNEYVKLIYYIFKY